MQCAQDNAEVRALRAGRSCITVVHIAVSFPIRFCMIPTRKGESQHISMNSNLLDVPNLCIRSVSITDIDHTGERPASLCIDATLRDPSAIVLDQIRRATESAANACCVGPERFVQGVKAAVSQSCCPTENMVVLYSVPSGSVIPLSIRARTLVSIHCQS